MQKIAKYVFFLLVALSMTGCYNEKQRTLRGYVNAINSDCPIPLGDIARMTEARYHGNSVEFTYLFSDKIDLEAWKSDDFYQLMLKSFESNTEESFCKLFDAIIDAQADLKVTMKPENPKNDFFGMTLLFVTDSLKAHRPTPLTQDVESQLQTALSTNRMQLPMHISDGIEWTSVELDKDYYIYYYECDETMCNIDEMRSSLVENRTQMVNMILGSNDPSFVKFQSLLVASHRGIRYVYQGNKSGNTAEFTIPCDELKQ